MAPGLGQVACSESPLGFSWGLELSSLKLVFAPAQTFLQELALTLTERSLADMSVYFLKLYVGLFDSLDLDL